MGGLRWSEESRAGIRRIRSGAGFRYVNRSGQSIRAPATLGRIRALAIPPAWRGVWICPHPNGHIQATGRDVRGRKQYRYHARWSESRNRTKFERLSEFGDALAALRRRTAKDLRLRGMPREKVLATIVQLLQRTAVRIGNDEYARSNHSYGLSTLRNRHVRVRGATVRFLFRGKSGVQHEVELHDPRIADVLRRCHDLPGQHLFEYRDDTGTVRRVTSSDVNSYLRRIMKGHFGAKDFRTWRGSVLAGRQLHELSEAHTQAAKKRAIVGAVRAVAEELRNTSATCRKYYIHPDLIILYESGELSNHWRQFRRGSNGLSADERSLLRFLKRQARTA